MKLFYSPGACSFAPHIVLEEIGKPYEVELVSTMDGSTQKEEYLNLNPKGRVPLLVDGKETITEASAILSYLALINPESKLIDVTPLQLTRTIEWMNWLATIHTQVIAQNWRAERFTDEVDAHKGIQSKGMEGLIEHAENMEKRAAVQSVLLSEDISLWE